MKEYMRKKEKPKPRRIAPILVALAVIFVIVAALTFYNSRKVASNTVYCGVFEYIILPAQTVVNGKPVAINETITTAVSFTTSTSITGYVGSTYKNVTNTIDASGRPIGAETICKYISNTTQ